MKRLLPHIYMMFLALAIITPRQALSAVDREQEVRDAVTAYVTSRTAGMGWDAKYIRALSSGQPVRVPGALDWAWWSGIRARIPSGKALVLKSWKSRRQKGLGTESR